MDIISIISSGIANGLIWAILGIGVYITYRILDIADLGIEGTFPLGASVVAILISVGVNPFIATLVAIIAGGIFGAITGILHTKFNIPAILSGIITMTGLFTINMLVLGGFKGTENYLSISIDKTIFNFTRMFLFDNKENIVLIICGIIILLLSIIFTVVLVKTIIRVIKVGFKNKLTSNIISVIIINIIILIVIGLLAIMILRVTNTVKFEFIEKLIIKGISIPVIAKIIVSAILLVIVFGVCYWFFGTEIGMSLRATGNNPRMAKAQGINTNAMIILGLVISNALVALCGAVFAQDFGSANITQGEGTIVVGLAVIVIGEAIFGRQDFKKSLISIIVGASIYYILEEVAVKLEVEHYLKLVRALLVTFVLIVPFIKKKFSKKIKKGGATYA